MAKNDSDTTPLNLPSTASLDDPIVDKPHTPGSGKPGSRGERRHHLDERLKILHSRALVIEQQLRQLEDVRHYRACIFGSARLKPETPEYQQVFDLARMLGWEGIDVLTGGGPGLMEAANKGAQLGKEESDSRSLSYGISIELDFEPIPNGHLDIKRHHYKFSSRLDDFMRLSHAVIATPGGVGTLLEVFFAWQLIQVKHISKRPIILLDKEFWTGIIDWMKQVPLGRGLVGKGDFDFIHIVDTPGDAYSLIKAHQKEMMAEWSVREK
jgi:uncharacterized protein (TIGR00730 family)